MRPLIYEAANADGFSEYYDGLEPTVGFRLDENFGNLGVLGNMDEPLLARAIADITGTGRFFYRPSFSEGSKFEIIPDERFKPKSSSEMFDLIRQQ